jgi:hypothetical protein
MCLIVSFSNEKSTTDQKKSPLRFIPSSDFIIENNYNIGQISSLASDVSTERLIATCTCMCCSRSQSDIVRRKKTYSCLGRTMKKEECMCLSVLVLTNKTCTCIMGNQVQNEAKQDAKFHLQLAQNHHMHWQHAHLHE